jgi:hypothetical protein
LAVDCGLTLFWPNSSMANFFLGLLFLSGLPICIFILPHWMWPWSTFLWFIGFIALERLIRNTAKRWRGRALPSGPAGFGIGIAIAVDDSFDSGGDSDGDGGGDGGGGD